MTRGAASRLWASARDRTPEPLLERIRLLLARRLEMRTRRSDAPRGAALVFHAVAPQAGDVASEIEPAVGVDELDAAIGYLTRRYAVVRASEMPGAARTRRAGERLPVAITFDDDLASHLEHAAPAIRRHGAVATAFLCGAGEPFWWQLLQTAVDSRAMTADALPHVEAALVGSALQRRPAAARQLARSIEELAPAERRDVAAALARAVADRPPLLGRDGADALASQGWEIGFHTREHDLLTTLDDAALRVALAPASRSGARTLAYPHGKATEREARVARDAGYVAAYTGRAEVFDAHTDDHLIGRLQPDVATVGGFALRLARALSAPDRRS